MPRFYCLVMLVTKFKIRIADCRRPRMNVFLHHFYCKCMQHCFRESWHCIFIRQLALTCFLTVYKWLNVWMKITVLQAQITTDWCCSAICWSVQMSRSSCQNQMTVESQGYYSINRAIQISISVSGSEIPQEIVLFCVLMVVLPCNVATTSH